jgi:catechol 2,3-dioxygenase-like lactoylglutathione lyase family enzyme
MKTATLLLVLILPLALSYGQNENDSSVTLDHFALSVKDVDQAAEFYKEVLHLKEITNKTKDERIRWLSLGDGKELHLVSTVEGDIKINKAVHLALATTDFDRIIAVLKDKDIEYSDWPGTLYKTNTRPDGIKQVYFQDPDGYWIEVNSVGQQAD